MAGVTTNMVRLSYALRYNLTAIGIVMVCLLVSCEDDSVEIEENPYPLAGIWYAVGDDISDVFRTFPFDVDSISLYFGSDSKDDIGFNRVIISKISKGYTAKTIISANVLSENPSNGALFKIDSIGYNNIYDIEIYDAARYVFPDIDSDTYPTAFDLIKINGIFSIIDDKEPKQLKMEFVYSHWSVDAPKPEDGFGSTSLGDHNIHLFTKYTGSNEGK